MPSVVANEHAIKIQHYQYLQLFNRQMSSSTPNYSIPTALDMIQREWVRFEAEREAWTAERRTLTSRVAHLESHVTKCEQINEDLIARIVLLEGALSSCTSHRNAPSEEALSLLSRPLPRRLAIQKPAVKARSLSPSPCPSDNDDNDNSDMLSGSLSSYSSPEPPAEPAPAPIPTAPLATAAAPTAASLPAPVPSSTIVCAPEGHRPGTFRLPPGRPAPAPAPVSAVPVDGLDVDVAAISTDGLGNRAWTVFAHLRSHLSAGRALAAAPGAGGSTLWVSGGDDGLVKVWSLVPGSRPPTEPLRTLRTHGAPVIGINVLQTSFAHVIVSCDALGKVVASLLPHGTKPYGAVDRTSQNAVCTWCDHKEAVWGICTKSSTSTTTTNVFATGDADGVVAIRHLPPAPVTASELPVSDSEFMFSPECGLSPQVWRQHGPAPAATTCIGDAIVRLCSCGQTREGSFLAATVSEGVFEVSWQDGTHRRLQRTVPEVLEVAVSEVVAEKKEESDSDSDSMLSSSEELSGSLDSGSLDSSESLESSESGSDSDSEPSSKVVLPRITGICAHPTLPLFITCATDGFIRAYRLPAAAPAAPTTPAPAQLLWTHRVHSTPCSALDISSDGRFLVTGCTDRTACLWDLGHSALDEQIADARLACIGEHSVSRSSLGESVTAVAWSPSDGSCGALGVDGVCTVMQ